MHGKALLKCIKSRNTLLAPTVYVSPLGAAKVNEQGLFSLQRGERCGKGYERGPGVRRTQRKGKLLFSLERYRKAS